MKIVRNNRLSAVIVGDVVLYPGTNVVQDNFKEEAARLLSYGVLELFEHADKLPDYKQNQLVRDCNSVSVAKKLMPLLGVKQEIKNRIAELEEFFARVDKANDCA